MTVGVVPVLYHTLRWKTISILLGASLSSPYIQQHLRQHFFLFSTRFLTGTKSFLSSEDPLSVFSSLLSILCMAWWRTVILFFVYIFTASATGFHCSFRLTGTTGLDQGKQYGEPRAIILFLLEAINTCSGFDRESAF